MQGKTELAARYDHREVESRWYDFWEQKNAFHAQDVSEKEPFCIVIPPPNVTGSLHMGHALTVTIEDIMIRWHRMLGHNTLWMPGTDHAGIATQMVVERELKRTEHKTRHDIGREEFVKRVWQWKEQYGNRISLQLRALGSSLDWQRERFTMDAQLSRAVREVFVRLYEEGLVYRAHRLINWCPRCQTALSDLEVEHDEGHAGSLWHIAYPVTGEPGREVVVATTRPETMLADTAVAVHPEDERYTDLVGKTVTLPLVGRQIPVVADDILVDREFGSGVVKVTPGHDFNDFETGLRHNLPMISMLDSWAKTTDVCGKYAGVDRFEARKMVLADLEVEGFLRKTESHSLSIGKCQRCETIVEPMLSDQWFVRTKPLAEPAVAAVEDGRVRIIPESHTKTYFHWMRNIQDWCISRQLWWGHQIPAWYCRTCGHVNVSREDVTACAACGSGEVVRDEDVLDTWFSSALWPFSTLGWPEDTPALKTFYPTNVMETGYDILFFWVARMMMMGMKFMGEPPFKTVYLHGMVLDKHGQKMSKVKGNVVDPLDVTQEVGADSLRFYLAVMSGQERSLRFDMERVVGYRNFINKVWNAARFALNHISELPAEPFSPQTLVLSLADRWILSRLAQTVSRVSSALEEYRFDIAADTLYHFFWHEFCDWYIEMVKTPLADDTHTERKHAAMRVLAHALDVSLRLLHPIMPYVTEELWQKLPVPRHSASMSGVTDTIVLASYPRPDAESRDEQAEREMAAIQETVTAIRTIRSETRVPPAAKIAVVVRADGFVRATLERHASYVTDLARLESLTVSSDASRPKASATAVVQGAAIYVPLEGLIDFEQEKQQLAKEIARIESYVAATRKKLENESFVSRAPAEVVQTEREKIAAAEASLERLRDTLVSIG